MTTKSGCSLPERPCWPLAASLHSPAADAGPPVPGFSPPKLLHGGVQSPQRLPPVQPYACVTGLSDTVAGWTAPSSPH